MLHYEIQWFNTFTNNFKFSIVIHDIVVGALKPIVSDDFGVLQSLNKQSNSKNMKEQWPVVGPSITFT